MLLSAADDRGESAMAWVTTGDPCCDTHSWNITDSQNVNRNIQEE